MSNIDEIINSHSELLKKLRDTMTDLEAYVELLNKLGATYVVEHAGDKVCVTIEGGTEGVMGYKAHYADWTFNQEGKLVAIGVGT